MPSNLQAYRQMAEHAATQLTGSHEGWVAFLRTAARLYKYPYNEQLMIHAQRPDATACAEFDFWNEKMGRYVRRGSKGIALIDANGDRPRLKYVFDVADTGSRDNSRSVNLWELKPEHTDSISVMLERSYDIPYMEDLRDQLDSAAAQLADEYWNVNQRDILDNIADSFLEGYDDFNIGMTFRNAATVSISYALMSRCGLDPDGYLSHEDFLSVFDFNTPATVASLGTAVSQISQQVLRQIEVSIRNYEREHSAERTAEHGELELHEERRLPDTQSEPNGADGEPRQVREDAEELPEGAAPGALESDGTQRDAIPASVGDRTDGEPAFGADDAGADESGWDNGEPESRGPDEVGGYDEQLQGTGRGDHNEGADFQLTLFPSEEEQIQMIEETESVANTPFAFSFPQEDIDHVLRLGGNNESRRMRVAAQYMRQKPLDEIAEFLTHEYKGGSGLVTENNRLSAWFTEDGIHLAKGDSARYVRSAQIISWSDAAARIDELLEQGRFATNVELAETDGYMRSQLAQSIWYLRRDFDETAIDQGFLPSLEPLNHGGYPDMTAKLAEALGNPEFLSTFTSEYEAFFEACRQNRNLLRFHYHRPAELLTQLRDLERPIREYHTDMSEVPALHGFITDDEISAALSYGNSVEGGKGRIYGYFSEQHTSKDQISFLKDEYGIGGHSNALPGSFRSFEDHGSKGIKVSKPNCDAVELSWSNVAKRITELVRTGRYLTPDEKAKYEELQQQKPEPVPPPSYDAEAGSLYDRYSDMKRETQTGILLYQVGDFFEMFGEDAETAADVLKLDLTYRNISPTTRMTMCGIPANRLEQYVEKLHDAGHDAVIYGKEELSGEMKLFRLDAPHKSEPITQDDIDEALRDWNGDAAGKRSVVEYMADHARDKDTAAWLAAKFGGADAKALSITKTGTDEVVELPWPKVQRRIAQLIKEDCFLTDHEKQPEEAVELPERFTVVDLYRGAEPVYEIWDDLHNGYYVDELGNTVDFKSRWEAEAYAQELNYPMVEKEADEPAIELPGAAPESLQDRTIAAMTAAGLHYDDIDSYDGYIVFRENDSIPYTFQSWDEAAEWIAGDIGDNPVTEPPKEPDFPYSVGDTVYLEDGKAFIVEEVSDMHIQLRDPTLLYPIWRSESRESFERLMERYPQPGQPETRTETVAFYPAERNNLPYDIVIQTLHTEPEINPPPENFRITDDNLGAGGAKSKFRMNMDAINLLMALEHGGRQATAEEQEVLAKYVGWGGLADAFDESKASWSNEYQELAATLTPEEYTAARSSTLNAHYTSPTVIRAIYEAVSNMGFQTGNILEPAMGVGNFFGCMPEEMRSSKLYGVELDSITGRIAKQLYPDADITVAGFETTDRRDFFDLAIGNVPFGQYQVNDRAYNKLGFSIHDYFFAKSLDQVRPGGVIAFVTSRYTMDKQSPEVRKYITQRADFLGAIRLPNNAFKANAGTDVVSDIIFLQKRDRPIEINPDWVHLGQNDDGFAINSYFIEHPEMILGRQTSESTQYGRQNFTVEPIEGVELADLLHEAVQNIRGTYTEAELPELGEGEDIDTSIPADPDVKNYSYTVVNGEVYYRENSRMVRPELNATAKERIKGMVELRDCVQKLIGQQMDGFVSDNAILQTQAELNTLYDAFTAKHGLINSRANSLAFADDSSYYLLCSLELLDEEGNLDRKADMFTKRTIKSHQAVASVDTASEALALSISERACVDMAYMSQLTGKNVDDLASELRGVIFRDFGGTKPEDIPTAWFDLSRYGYVTADEYLSGNVRQKLRLAEHISEILPPEQREQVTPNIEALRAAQPKDLDASEIEVRLGATWIDKEYIQEFMYETFDPPFYLRRGIEVNFSTFTAEWNITGKSNVGYNNINAYMTYGTERANAYKILEDTLNLRDVRIYDTKYDADGKEKRVLNSKETTLAQQKQQAIKDAFQDWIWKDPDRRRALVEKYNELFNSTRPREYDGSHLVFSGMNPEISLREHQLNAIAHVIYGGNTLLAHEVGAGKTFEMVAAAMESKRRGLCQKSLFAVPNHLTEQWAAEFLRLYPSANILVATKKDFETRNRKKFCARIATGDYDAVIIGHSQFERIPVSVERQERLLQEQIWEIQEGLEELRESRAERFTIKSLERTKKSIEARLKKLQDSDRKDDVVTFEQLGVDRLFVDEAHSFKNLFLFTKMRNVEGLSTTDAQKSSDMLLKCRYLDELTGSKGVVFATGTPVSNSMTELYTMMRYLQHSTIRQKGLAHFDCWASTFGETQTAIELAPEGTGYRARTRFAKFFNLPELMTLFKEAADIKTSDQLNLPTPTAIYHNEVAQPTEIQKAMVQELSERAARVHSGLVDASEDNMLKITSDGRKLGLDQRVINSDLPDEPQSKVNMCVDNIYRIWDEGQPDKLTQLVFCDLSTPRNAAPARRAAKAAGGNLDMPELNALERLLDKESSGDDAPFTVYDDIREKLVARGIPREQIAFIHEANTEVRKKELYAKVRSGQVRVLMGSTFKMGSGMNVQDRLVALHDLDAPWRPGDLEQRSGRIIRQGNKNKEVHIYRYVTEATFDAYLWQTLENKQKFISQIMTSKSPVRSCEDIDETALSYAEIKALCAGDERIKEKMDLDVDVSRLKLMRASHQSQQFKLEDNLLKFFPEQIEQCKGFIAGFEADMKTVAEHPHPKDGFAGMVVKGDALTDKDNAGAALLEAFKDVRSLEPVPIGEYRGFAMSLTLEDFGREYVLTLKGEMSHRVSLGKDPRGNLIRIDNALNAIPDRKKNVEAKLENLHTQMDTARSELGKPFPQEEEYRTKSARLAELNAALNIDERTPIEQLSEETEIAKTSRPSVLAKLETLTNENENNRGKSFEEEI